MKKEVNMSFYNNIRLSYQNFHFDSDGNLFSNHPKNCFNFNLDRNLLSYDSKKGFTISPKYATKYQWVNNIVKFFRKLFYPETRISAVLDGFIIEAKKITDNQDKIAHLKIAKVFKDKIIGTHKLQAGNWKTNISTDKFDQELDNLAESILKNEPNSTFREQVKNALIEGNLKVTKDSLIDLINLSEACNIPDISNLCGYFISNTCRKKDPDLDTLRFFQRVMQQTNSVEINDLIKLMFNRALFYNFVDSIYNSKSDFSEVISIANECGFSRLKEVCENKFGSMNYNLLIAKEKKSSIIIPEEKGFETRALYEFSHEQFSAIRTDTVVLEKILEESIAFGFNKSAIRFYTILLDNVANLCLKSPVEELENAIQENQELLQNYLGILQKYSKNIHQICPDKEQFQVLALLFDGTLFSPERGQKLFKHIFSLYIWDEVNSSIFYERRPRNFKEPHPRIRLTEIFEDKVEMNQMYSEVMAISESLGLDWLKKYFLNSIFSNFITFIFIDEEYAKIRKDVRQTLREQLQVSISLSTNPMTYRQIKKKYQNWLRINHPDKNNDASATEKVQIANGIFDFFTECCNPDSDELI
jgi:hypothetical protein